MNLDVKMPVLLYAGRALSVFHDGFSLYADFKNEMRNTNPLGKRAIQPGPGSKVIPQGLSFAIRSDMMNVEEEVSSVTGTQTISDIKRIVGEIARQYGVERIYLFGSYARGEATETSDIDLRIDRGLVHGLQFAGLLGDLEDALGRKVDLISTKGMDRQFRQTIAPDEVLLYERV